MEKLVKAELSGLAFSRDPGSGRRGRIIIEAASARRTLDERTGRVLESEGVQAFLSPARLRRLARVVRALDAWRGTGVEVAFSFAGEKLLVHSARALEVPAPPRPVLDPFSPRPEAQALPVKNAR